MKFAAQLRDGLNRLDAVGPGHRRGQVTLAELLLPRRDALLDLLAELEQLAPIAEEHSGPLVLCHTDMGGNNVLVDEKGAAWILDWDGLILAPAEHDLAEQRGPGFTTFLRMYRQAGGICPLYALQFAFYLQRRYLSDLNDWLLRILDVNADPVQDAHDLAGIEGYSLFYIDRFAQEIDEITHCVAAM
jgi:hypothetical protein